MDTLFKNLKAFFTTRWSQGEGGGGLSGLRVEGMVGVVSDDVLRGCSGGGARSQAELRRV